ncbi:MAG TPA: tetratricopeptide repeat protein, partial [Bryobacteraceae bacterium]|nr:tetratricopeptide repeat protein [Bryobacteraceae bacterium]
AVCLTHPCPASAQMDMSGHTMETRDETPPDRLPVPQRMTGIGNVHMRITATPEAQMWFNQGLNLLHDFWDYESARAFEQSVRVDPHCAMCYWGLYAAESFYHSNAQGYARQALTMASSLEHHASKRERLYIEATAAHQNAPQLWHKLVRKYPKDTEARIFLSRVVDHKESVALLQSVLKDDPDNSAANHYYIHALEWTDHPEQALHSAEILPSLAPASGHMVHMPGHIFFRLGDYARAGQSFAASMQVDERYMREQHVQPDNDWNYVHNLMYAVANLMEEGKLKEATALSTKLTGARGELESTLYIYSSRDSISRLDPRLPVALRTANWAQVIELLHASPPPAERPNLDFLSRQLISFAAGMQAVEAHNLSKAEELSTQLDSALSQMSRPAKDSPKTQTMGANNVPGVGMPKLQVMPDALLQPLLKTLSILSLELRACLLTAQGKIPEAKALFTQAEHQQEALGYREPPSYIRPVGEAEGAAMISLGHWADARAAYQQALRDRPRSGFALYGIAICTEKSGDLPAAAKQYAAFLTAWKNADPDLPQLMHAQTCVARHPPSAEGQNRVD